jgi:tRNA uridine 5-carboxymethylaminomethyl modification enzyme
VENDLKYEGYIKRMMADVEKFRKAEQKRIPEDFNYGMLNSLSTEARQKLERIRPETVGQAGRISGISATDLSILTVYLSR